jgi:predicted esterase
MPEFLFARPDRPAHNRARRSRHRHPQRAALALVAVLAGVLALSASSASASPRSPRLRLPPPPSCPGVTFIGARGSGESLNGFDGVGPAVDRMATVLSSRLAAHRVTTSIVPDFYPADSVSDLQPSASVAFLLLFDPGQGLSDYIENNLAKYLNSIDTGVNDAVSEVQQAVAACPSTKVVLAGYSQGAMVMHEAELQLGPGLLNHISGTLLLGDGDRVPNTRAKEFGSSLARAEGIQVYLHGTAHDVPRPATTANICNARDIVCDFNFVQLAHFSQSAKVHTSYAVNTAQGMTYSPLLAQAANWLAGRMGFR